MFPLACLQTCRFTDKWIDIRKWPCPKLTADGMTALYDATAAALEHLKKGNRDKKVLIVVSDGGDNASKDNFSEVMSLAGRSNKSSTPLVSLKKKIPNETLACSSGWQRPREVRPSCRNL